MKTTTPSEYHDILVPNFDFGAKRPVLDHGYLAALNSSQVKLLRSDSMTIIGPHQVQVDNGKHFDADVIVLANGFKTQEMLVSMRIIGHGGAELPRIWQQEDSYAQAYMGYVWRLCPVDEEILAS
jgi:cation diffusion facilitator CzcD-associated flavoprotein CzcO